MFYMSAKESLGLPHWRIDVNLPVHMWTGEQILRFVNERWRLMAEKNKNAHQKEKKPGIHQFTRETEKFLEDISSERFVVAKVWWSPTSVTCYPQLVGHKADVRRKSWQQWLSLTSYDVILKATQPQIYVIKSLMSLLIWQGLLNQMRHVRPLKQP